MGQDKNVKRFGSFVKRVVAGSAGMGIILFVLYWIVVSQTSNNPVKEQTKQTGRLIFTMFYTAMQNGWGEREIDMMTQRINQDQDKMHVELYRGPLVEALYGKRAEQKPFRMINEDEISLAEEGMIRYRYAIKFEHACLQCHINADIGNTAGVLELVFPLGDFSVSSGYLVKMMTAIFIVTLLSISFVLYRMLKRQFILPLDDFVTQVDTIMSHKDLRKEVVVNTTIAELDHLKNAFNKLRGELADSFETIKHSAEKDELTGVYNRLKLNEVLTRYAQSPLAASMLLFDLDKFKPINDRYGHDVGDEVLKRFANVILQNLKGRDYVFRLGGDEFLALLPHTQAIDAELIALQIQEELRSTPLVVDHGMIVIGCSYGLVYSEDIGHSFDELFRKADQSMYADKNAKNVSR